MKWQAVPLRASCLWLHSWAVAVVEFGFSAKLQGGALWFGCGLPVLHSLDARHIDLLTPATTSAAGLKDGRRRRCPPPVVVAPSRRQPRAARGECVSEGVGRGIGSAPAACITSGSFICHASDPSAHPQGDRGVGVSGDGDDAASGAGVGRGQGQEIASRLLRRLVRQVHRRAGPAGPVGDDREQGCVRESVSVVVSVVGTQPAGQPADQRTHPSNHRTDRGRHGGGVHTGRQGPPRNVCSFLIKLSQSLRTSTVFPLTPHSETPLSTNAIRTEAADGGKTAFATLTNLTLGAENTLYGRLRFYLESAPGAWEEESGAAERVGLVDVGAQGFKQKGRRPSQ